MAQMKSSHFLIMLKRHFGYRIGGKIANGRDLHYENDWVGFLSYDGRTDKPRGFVIAYGANHLRAMCTLHEQRIIE